MEQILEMSKPIIEATAAKHSITVEQLLGPRRQQTYVAARRECAERLRNELEMSYPKIGKVMNRDHTSILHLLKKVEA